MLEKLNIKNCIIACQDGLIYGSPAHVSRIASCNISRSINVRVNGMPTISTFLESSMSRSISPMTPITFFGSVSRINVDNPYSFSESLVFYKALELVESPLVYPLIISCSLSDTTQIFHNNNITFIQIRYNRSTYVMISPTHKPRPCSRELFEFSLGTSGAFALEFTNKFVSLYPQGFNFVTVKNIFGSDSEIINPQVHPENFVMLVRSHRSFLGECECEVRFIFGLGKQTFNNLPIFKIFQSIVRNLNGNFNSTLNSRDTQNIIFKRETSRGIVSNRNIIDNGAFTFTLQDSTSHFYTGSRELSRKSNSSKFRINMRMEFNIVIDSKQSSIINTILKSLLVKVNSINYNIINFNLNRNTSNQHNNSTDSDYLNISEADNSSPQLIEGSPCLRNL